MVVALYNILEWPIEPCEDCNQGIDVDIPETYASTPTGLICCGCEERQIAFEDAIEEVEFE